MESSLAAACTKARAGWGKLLNKEQYEMLLEAGSSFEVLKFLKKITKYKKILNNNELDDKGLIEIEEKLMQFYMNEIYRFSYYLHSNYKLFFKIIFLKYQIEDIKKVLRFKNAKYIDKNEIIFMTEACPMNKLNFEKLMHAVTLEEAAQMLKNTIYYNSVHEFSNDKSEAAYFNFETQLDYEYLKAVNSLNKMLKGKNSIIVGQLIGEYEDLLILKSIFRIKKYFNNGKIDIRKLENTEGFRIKETDIKELNEAKDINEFIKLVQKYNFGEIYTKSLKNNSSIQKEIEIFMKKLYAVQKWKNSNNIGIVIAYYEMFMYEIKNIISILEGKKYNIKADIAEKYII